MRCGSCNDFDTGASPLSLVIALTRSKSPVVGCGLLSRLPSTDKGDAVSELAGMDASFAISAENKRMAGKNEIGADGGVIGTIGAVSVAPVSASSGRRG